jgi:hypothetical protein
MIKYFDSSFRNKSTNIIFILLAFMVIFVLHVQNFKSLILKKSKRSYILGQRSPSGGEREICISGHPSVVQGIRNDNS